MTKYPRQRPSFHLSPNSIVQNFDLPFSADMALVSLGTSLLQTPNISNLLKLFSLTIVVKYIHYLYFQTRYWPPGPRGIPILGNIFQLPKLPWYKFTEWKAQYGAFYILDQSSLRVTNKH